MPTNILDNPRHRAELLRAMRNHHYDVANGGVYFPKQRVFVGGHFETTLNGGDLQISPNVVTIEGINQILTGGTGLAGNFYIAPFSNATDPAETLTAATFTATMGEVTAYTASNRLPWTKVGASGSLTNAASPAQFTISVVNTDIRGFAILSVQTKSATTGVCLAAARLATARDDLQINDVIGSTYVLTATDDSA